MQLNLPFGLRFEKDLDNHAKYPTFKYTLNCSQCDWNNSFYEASGSIYLDSHKMTCPFCKHKEIRWMKSIL